MPGLQDISDDEDDEEDDGIPDARNPGPAPDSAMLQATAVQLAEVRLDEVDEDFAMHDSPSLDEDCKYYEFASLQCI